MTNTPKTKTHSSGSIVKFFASVAGVLAVAYVLSAGLGALNTMYDNSSNPLGFEIAVGVVFMMLSGIVAIAITYFNHKWLD